MRHAAETRLRAGARCVKQGMEGLTAANLPRFAPATIARDGNAEPQRVRAGRYPPGPRRALSAAKHPTLAQAPP